MRRGDKGPNVTELQQQLEIAADGDYGPKTEAAVRAFQAAHGLTVDGIAGPQTQACLLANCDQLALAGRQAVAHATWLWEQDIFDPRRDDKSAAAIDSKLAITAMIRKGLGWTWEPNYVGDGDFEWCGAFASACWSRVKPLLRRAYFASTYRLDRFASYRPVNGEINVGKGRLLAELDAQSTALPWQPRAGDILLIGSGNPGYGQHICLVESYAAGVFQTLEGNGNGLGPHGERQHGVVRAQRKLGGPGWHARRLIRPSVDDLE